MSDVDSSGGSWQPDPLGRHAYRWWTGTAWSDQVHSGTGAGFNDPLGSEPTPPAVTPFDGTATYPAASPPPFPPTAPASNPPQYYPPNQQTPNFNLPGGGAWAAPQQIVMTNASKSPGLAIASLVLGVGAFFFSLIPVVGWASIPFAIVGLALGISGIVRSTKGFEGRGLSLAGVAGSLAALFVSAIYIFAVGAAVDDIPDVNSDPANGVCDESRFLTDPDC